MDDLVLNQKIVGAKNIKSIFIALIVLIGGCGFFLTGISSYLKTNIFLTIDISQISFIPQGIILLFYGSSALTFSLLTFLYITWNVGSGYNEFSKIDETVRIVRLGFPGKNRRLFFTYEFKNIKKIKLLIREGLNPRTNLLLVLKDKREIPLFPPQLLFSPTEIEKKGVELANFLNVSIEKSS
jgi:hypothetical protein